MKFRDILNEIRVNNPTEIAYGVTHEGNKVKINLEDFSSEDRAGPDSWHQKFKSIFISSSTLTEIFVHYITENLILRCSNLIDLNCYVNKITTLDVSQCPNLKYLSCDHNNLTTLNVSKNPNLAHLYCHNNNLTTLDVSNCPNLIILFCGDNNLTTLDVSKNPKLEHLNYNKDETKLIKNLNEINVNYYQRILDISNNLSISQRKYIQGIIDSLNMRGNEPTPKQAEILRRLKIGDFRWPNKN